MHTERGGTIPRSPLKGMLGKAPHRRCPEGSWALQKASMGLQASGERGGDGKPLTVLEQVSDTIRRESENNGHGCCVVPGSAKLRLRKTCREDVGLDVDTEW